MRLLPLDVTTVTGSRERKGTFVTVDVCTRPFLLIAAPVTGSLESLLLLFFLFFLCLTRILRLRPVLPPLRRFPLPLRLPLRLPPRLPLRLPLLISPLTFNSSSTTTKPLLLSAVFLLPPLLLVDVCRVLLMPDATMARVSAWFSLDLVPPPPLAPDPDSGEDDDGADEGPVNKLFNRRSCQKKIFITKKEDDINKNNKNNNYMNVKSTFIKRFIKRDSIISDKNT